MLRASSSRKATPRMARRQSGGDPGRRLRRRLVLSLTAALSLAVIGWELPRIPHLISGSQRFALRSLEIEGLHMVRREEVLQASGVHMGDNILSVDPRAVRRRLEALPWVRSARVWRVPPDRIEVQLTERKRAAWVRLGRTYCVDDDGVVLPGSRQPAESPHEMDLPVVSGLDCRADSLRPGMSVPDPVVLDLLRWWGRLRRADEDFSANISEIQPMGPKAVRLRLVGDGLEVRMPRNHVAHRIRTLKELIKRVYRECPAPAYIDMRFAGQAVVGTREQNP